MYRVIFFKLVLSKTLGGKTFLRRSTCHITVKASVFEFTFSSVFKRIHSNMRLQARDRGFSDLAFR